MKYLITGKKGQLAGAFIKKCEEQSITCETFDRTQLDVTDLNAVVTAVESCKPDVIINCAAYNLVDKAEQEAETAFAVNVAGPKHLAHAARKRKAFLVHFGTDYVFDGMKQNGPYTEDDDANPLNVYGKSKREGEEIVLNENEKSLVFRLSWVFGEGSQNFIYKLLEWSNKNEYIRIACDEFSVPTYTETVVDVVMKALKHGLTGLYHLTNSGFCSRYEWARLVLDTMKIDKFVRPVSMDTFNLPAKRPKFSPMSNARISKLLGVRIPAWEEDVKSFLRERNIVHE